MAIKNTLSLLGQYKTSVKGIDFKLRLEGSIYHRQERKVLTFYSMIATIINVLGGGGWAFRESLKVYLKLADLNKY